LTSGELLLTGAPVQARGVCIHKGAALILRDVSLSLEKGSFGALVGPSGSGKTSLLRTLALLDKPSAGTLLHWGQDLGWYAASKRFEGHEVHPRITYVPQTLGLWPHMTLQENLDFVLDGRESAKADICDQLGVASVLDRLPGEVSQGQRQRVALARALILQPEVLLLDEITSALDEVLALKVWHILQRVTARGPCILASTHDQRLAALCAPILSIKESTLVRIQISG
jgi:ABC-type lipoprotein export system ATPase subunit